jgi:hypothetical protein
VNSFNEIKILNTNSEQIAAFKTDKKINVIKALPNGNLAIEIGNSIEIYNLNVLKLNFHT